ncbi:MAG: hypothetical protein KA521_00610 [Crocinitomicaceae bacterium]|nr:hypothetical protein [Crocinitomicaceae bacterium]
MRKLLFLLTIVTIISSCKKEDTRPECEKSNTGTLIIDNWLSDPYYIFVDGNYKGIVSSYGASTLTSISAGYHQVRVENQNDVLDLQTSTESVPQCGSLTLKIE